MTASQAQKPSHNQWQGRAPGSRTETGPQSVPWRVRDLQQQVAGRQPARQQTRNRTRPARATGQQPGRSSPDGKPGSHTLQPHPLLPVPDLPKPRTAARPVAIKHRDLFTIAKTLLLQPLCDPCLGRQFGQLLSGFTNTERGRAIRLAMAMAYDSGPFPVEPANFSGLRFRHRLVAAAARPCSLCAGLFSRLDSLAEQAAAGLSKTDAKTFAVGTLPGPELAAREGALWEAAGIDHCEPLRAEVNRELGKKIVAATGLEAHEQGPEAMVLADLAEDRVSVEPSPLFVFGFYQKLARGIPQAKWETYATSVEEIIARPFIRATRGVGHAIHAAGREDVDARCLGWRPFVLEISKPLNRHVPLAKVQQRINKGSRVKVRGLRPSNKAEVRIVKQARLDKTYRITAVFETPVPDLAPLEQLLLKPIRQKTPERVLHRRADKTRTRRVKAITWKRLNTLQVQLVITADAGLYVKELVTGDHGRTQPSVAELLKTPAAAQDLDVIAIDARTLWKATDSGTGRGGSSSRQ